MKGEFYKTVHGFNSYEMLIYPIADILEKNFHFEMDAKPIIAPTEVFWGARREEIKITLGWDIWSGVFVSSHDSTGNPVITEIGKYLNSYFVGSAT